MVTQPMPTPNDQPHIADLVVADLHERKQLGIQRYGTPLQPHNGRDALQDAYEEALDLAQYLRQAIEERKPQSVSRSDQERAILEYAEQMHHKSGCRCTPRYRMSCPRMTEAILSYPKERKDPK